MWHRCTELSYHSAKFANFELHFFQNQFKTQMIQVEWNCIYFRINKLLFFIETLGIFRWVGRWGVSRFSGSGRVNGLSFVTNFGAVTVLISAVSDDLSAAVGQEDAVLSGHHTPITDFLVSVIVVGRFVFDGVSERVRLRGLLNI